MSPVRIKIGNYCFLRAAEIPVLKVAFQYSKSVQTYCLGERWANDRSVHIVCDGSLVGKRHISRVLTGARFLDAFFVRSGSHA